MVYKILFCVFLIVAFCCVYLLGWYLGEYAAWREIKELIYKDGDHNGKD